MRKLLLFFAMFCVSIGTWATPTVSTSTWMQNNSEYETQTVASIWIENPGELAAALSQVGVDFQYLHLSAFNSSNPLELSPEDIAALNALDVKTIEMNHVYAPYFEFNNPYVEYITLPYNWTKAQVKAVGETHKTHPNFKACISTSDTEGSGDATLIAYLKKAGTMRDAILHSYFDTRDYKTLGSGNGDCCRVRTLVAMGNVCAKDISRAGNYDANGHYVINGVADENSITYNMNTEGGDLYSGGSTDGAIVGCYDINVIDLSEAIIPDAYCTDIIPGYAFVTTNLREFWIPENSDFKTIPADFMNCSAAIHQICIPGNIETIKTRAFAGTNVNYIWTTGSDPSVRYDNGATFITGAGTDSEVRAQRYKTDVGKAYTATAGFDPAEEYPLFQSGDDNSFNYGTITLPAGLKLIERFAFMASNSVSDVYVLNATAPECHVDAFNSNMYHANNTLQTSNIKTETDDDGNTIKIITRDAYNNGINQPTTILHYPQETTDPNIQRFTDPTREYSIATGDRDGKGNMIYFPTHTEMEVAEWQGTYGYVWNAWNIERTWYNQEITLGTGQGWYGTVFNSSGGHDQQGGQALANQYYIDNPNANKTDRSFYDVTLGDNNQPGDEANPTGLQPYYNTQWKGYQLYPQMETTTTTQVIGERQKVDADGNLMYEPCQEGDFVKDFRYVEDPEGGYVETKTPNGSERVTAPVEGVTTYYSDSELTIETTPKVGSGFWYQDGMKDVVTALTDGDKNGDIRDHDQYYNANGSAQDVYFSSNHSPLWYATDEEETVTLYEKICDGWKNLNDVLAAGVSEYYKSNGDGTYSKFLPEFNGGTYYYYKDGEYLQTSSMVEGVTTYYSGPTWSGDTYHEANPQLKGDAIYKSSGTIVRPVYASSDKYLPGKTWYEKSGDSYNSIAKMDWWNYARDINSTTFYYASGQEKNIVSAENTDYDSSETYYTNAEGTAEAESVTFSTACYVQAYSYAYAPYTGQEGKRVRQVEYYRDRTDADGDAQPYCPMMEDVYAVVKGNQYDYRGWHQFVLAGYGYNGVVPNEPIRSFITDNDWWTICEPYDLRYNDMIEFFGTNVGALYKKPYLSKLMYVIRDVEKGKITLMFSKNLMEYKETTASDGQVHGTIDDKTTWIGNGEGQYADEAALRAANPVILHKGVPYLIKPNLLVDDDGNITGTRQFNIYKNDNIELYNRLEAAAKQGAGAQASMIYDGVYTVPAYVVGLGKEGAGTEAVESSGTKTITNKDGSSFTYKDSENGGKLVYGGKEVDYKISSKYTYSFVGSLYNSLMPQYCYFLGYDSKKKQAVFRYSVVQDKSGWNWNNQTGIICPNFDTNTKIHSATGFDDPARWTIAGANGSDLQPDDITMATGSAKSYTFDFGATNYFEMEEATGVSEMVVKPLYEETKVYDTNGIYRGSSLQNLPKGVYIVNGKKYVVK